MEGMNLYRMCEAVEGMRLIEGMMLYRMYEAPWKV